MDARLVSRLERARELLEIRYKIVCAGVEYDAGTGPDYRLRRQKTANVSGTNGTWSPSPVAVGIDFDFWGLRGWLYKVARGR